jgi:peptidoglycan/LPS O-acetylase OafA/YrhL
LRVVILLAACGDVSTEDTILWGIALGLPTLAYLAALIVPVARARGERRYVVPLCLASAAIGAGLAIAGGFDDDAFFDRILYALGIGALLGIVAFAFRRRRPVTYVLAPLLSGGLAGLGFLVLIFAAFLIGDVCLS